MSLLNAPKAMYKAQQAKKQMSKIEVAGRNGNVSVLMNGLNDIVEVEIDKENLLGSDSISRDEFSKIANKLSEEFKKAVADAKKQLEKEIMNSSSMEDIKGMLGL